MPGISRAEFWIISNVESWADVVLVLFKTYRRVLSILNMALVGVEMFQEIFEPGKDSILAHSPYAP